MPALGLSTKTAGGKNFGMFSKGRSRTETRVTCDAVINNSVWWNHKFTGANFHGLQIRLDLVSVYETLYKLFMSWF